MSTPQSGAVRVDPTPLPVDFASLAVSPRHPDATALQHLTPREREILVHLARGLSNKLIGRALGIEESTVKVHVKSILRKLRVHSRVEALLIAVTSPDFRPA